MFQLYNKFKKLRQVTYEIKYKLSQFLTSADYASSKLFPFRFLIKDMVFKDFYGYLDWILRKRHILLRFNYPHR